MPYFQMRILKRLVEMCISDHAFQTCIFGLKYVRHETE